MKISSILVGIGVCLVAQQSFAISEKENNNINDKVVEICENFNGQIELNTKGVIICKVNESSTFDKKYLKSIYKEIKDTSLFIAWDIKDKKKYSYSFGKSSNLTKQRTVNIDNKDIDIYVYYSNIKDKEKRIADIKPANKELVNSIEKETKNIKKMFTNSK